MAALSILLVPDALLDRWKHKEADKLNFKDLIEKLKPSKILCLDDLDSERSTRKHLITSDRKKVIFSILVLF